MEENTNFSDMSDSILSSVKKLVGISDQDSSFDLDIMLHVNGAAAVLYQLGVLENPFTVTSKSDTYQDMLPGVSSDIINQVKLYFSYKTKLGFDTSGMTSAVIEVLKEMAKEAEYRLMISVNPKGCFD